MVTGAIYALVASGYSLVYSTTRIFHVAYAAVFTFGSYMTLLTYRTGLPLWASVLLAGLLSAILSVLINGMVYEPMKRRGGHANVYLISSIGVLVVLENALALAFGAETQVFTTELSPSIALSTTILSRNQLYQFLSSAAILAVLMTMLKRSSWGLRIRAIRDDEALYRILGFKSSLIRPFLFAVSGFMASVAGSLVGFDVGCSPYMGMPILLNSFVAMILGGIGSLGAPIVGGVILGLMQSCAALLFSTQWQPAVTFLVLLIVLLVRPQGFLGERGRLV